MATAVRVSSNQIVKAKAQIARAVEHHEAYVDGLSDAGVLMAVLMDLGIVLDVAIANGEES